LHQTVLVNTTCTSSRWSTSEVIIIDNADKIEGKEKEYRLALGVFELLFACCVFLMGVILIAVHPAYVLALIIELPYSLALLACGVGVLFRRDPWPIRWNWSLGLITIAIGVIGLLVVSFSSQLFHFTIAGALIYFTILTLLGFPLLFLTFRLGNCISARGDNQTYTPRIFSSIRKWRDTQPLKRLQVQMPERTLRLIVTGTVLFWFAFLFQIVYRGLLSRGGNLYSAISIIDAVLVLAGVVLLLVGLTLYIKAQKREEEESEDQDAKDI